VEEKVIINCQQRRKGTVPAAYIRSDPVIKESQKGRTVVENTAFVENDNMEGVCQNNGKAGGVIGFKTTRFGELEVAEDRLISFPLGLLGFPAVRSFVLLDYENDEVPFKWLQSTDDPDVAFLVMDPRFIKPDYSLSLKRSVVAEIGEFKEEDIAILVILTIPEGNPKNMSANLRGPLVVNSINMMGKQVVLEDAGYPIKYPVFN